MKRILLAAIAALLATTQNPAVATAQNPSVATAQNPSVATAQNPSVATAQNAVAAPSPAATRHPAEPEMVFVEGGTFMMGSAGEGAMYDEAPVHQVTLSDFQIGKYEVTQGQWEALMGTTVADLRDKVDPSWPLYGVGDDIPVYYVSWDDAREFARRLSAATGKRYALPTEAQWEFAARGGNESRGYAYSGGDILDEVARHDGPDYRIPTHPVGGKLPNELGIHDMSGNVAEWCADWYGHYSADAQTDPVGPPSGTDGRGRIIRGGDRLYDTEDCRTTCRSSARQENSDDSLGFRVVCIP